MTREEVEHKTNLEKVIRDFIGKQVTAYVGGETRNNFNPAINVSGELEENPLYKNDFRIVKDDSTYTYFKLANIKRIVAHASHVFKGGSVAIIHLEI